jgi:hypothetical protein
MRDRESRAHSRGSPITASLVASPFAFAINTFHGEQRSHTHRALPYRAAAIFDSRLTTLGGGGEGRESIHSRRACVCISLFV